MQHKHDEDVTSIESPLKTLGNAYNTRLFSSGIRRYLHLSRFYWLAHRLTQLNGVCSSVVELGCFDGKVLDFLPTPPLRYVGFDANWEGGLELARERWGHIPQYTFRRCQNPDELELSEPLYDLAICMDTLEHVRPHDAESYIAALTRAAQSYIVVTVPNEKGLVFLSKYLMKRLWIGRARPYTLSEICYATLGRLDRVARNEHKGFDYASIIRIMAQYSRIVHVSGYPFSWLPVNMNFGVGIVGKIESRQGYPGKSENIG